MSLALECLSMIATDDLARDLTPEVFTLLSSSKVLIRKKAIAVVLTVFGKCPDAVRVCFKRLVDNLENSDPQTVSATVGVFCELTTKEPRSYLPLAPEFYKILVDSRHNWVLIKVLKIFAKLAPLEPRLAKRIVEPICEHMKRTGAKSLLFECIRTVVSSLSEYESAVKSTVPRIREFLVDDDPNLKYLGLHALAIVAPKHLSAVLENKEVVIKSLSDEDPNIKLESLRLVMSMVSEDNVAEIARVLINYALKSDPQFCNEILGSILLTCSGNLYEIIVDFDWYVSLLGEISRIPHCQKGEEIENQLIDIGLRVKDVRPQLVHVGRSLLIDPALLGNPFFHRTLSAAAWVSGEYVEFLRDPLELMEALLQPRTSLLPPSIRAVYIQSIFKVLIFCLNCYFSQGNGAASSSNHDALGPEVSELTSRECGESCDLGKSELDETFNPRVLDQSLGGLSAEKSCFVPNSHVQTSTSASLGKHNFTHESIVNLLDLVELCLDPLSGSHDVEIQERARNVLGFIYLIKQEILKFQNEGAIERGDLEASRRAIELVHDAFSEDLGPVSVSAQGRVPLPDGLILKEDLGDLETICADIPLPSSNSFYFGSANNGEDAGISLSNLDIKEELEPSNESTSLLAEHRKRHGLYYLPSEKGGIASNDYPPANDPKLSEGLNDANDLVKLAEQSFVPKKRSNHVKPRPVVVKLDEGDGMPMVSKKPELKDDLLSGAVRDVLLGNEDESTSSRNNPFGKPPSKKKGKEKQNMDNHLEAKENLGDTDKANNANSSSRRSKHHNQGKERRHKKKNAEEREENDSKEKQKSSHRPNKHKCRQKAEKSLDVVPQSPVVPDLLL